MSALLPIHSAPRRCASKSRAWPRLWMGSTLLVALAGACRGDTEQPRVCGAPQPAFRLHVHSLQGPLPELLDIEVGFGGAQSEAYRLGSASRGDVVCCVALAERDDAPTRIPCAGGTPSAGASSFLLSSIEAGGNNHIEAGLVRSTDAGLPDAGLPDARLPDAGAPDEVNHVVCDLWTNGAADLTVLVDGLERVQQTLPARQQEAGERCGLLETVEAVLVLDAPDAGVVLHP